MKYISFVKSHSLIIAILVAGLVYLLILQSLIPNDTYITGDAGLKAMLSQNLARGNTNFSLDFGEKPWIKPLWDAGLFPYEEPYVYYLSGKYFITFPYSFPLITMPFYKLLGYRGYYVVPLLATVGIWLLFFRVCKKLGFTSTAIGIGITLLIFTTNLTFYSATYSEQTIAVCLSFAGLSLVIPAAGSKRINLWVVLLAGILSSLAVWFRPEQIFLVIYLDFLSLLTLFNKKLKQSSASFANFDMIAGYIGKYGWAYLLTSTLALLTYGLTNWLIYNNFLGVHGIQLVENQPFLERLTTAIGNFNSMTVGDFPFFVYAPIALFPFGYLLLSLIKPTHFKLEAEWKIWYVFCLAFVIGVSVLVPAGAGGKQWGPRFLLFLVPVLILLFTWQLDHLLKFHNLFQEPFRATVLAAALFLGVNGIIQNPFRGTDFLINTYNQIGPAVQFLQAKSEPVIAISDKFIGQVLQPSLNSNKVFLWVKYDYQLAMLSQALLNQSQDTLTYICYTGDCNLFNPKQNTRHVEFNGTGNIVQIVNYKEYEKYTIVNYRVFRDN